MRIMAIDYGDARTGVALSDLTGTLVGETLVVAETSQSKVITQLCTLAAERKVGSIVVGYPKNMDGTLGARAVLCEKFAAKLAAKSGLECRLWDERRTTIDANRILSEVNKRGAKRKALVDAVAASLILEGYLGSLR